MVVEYRQNILLNDKLCGFISERLDGKFFGV